MTAFVLFGLDLLDKWKRRIQFKIPPRTLYLCFMKACSSYSFFSCNARHAVEPFTCCTAIVILFILSTLFLFSLCFSCLMFMCFSISFFQSTMRVLYVWHMEQTTTEAPRKTKKYTYIHISQSEENEMKMEWKPRHKKYFLSKFAQVKAFPVNWVQSIDCFFLFFFLYFVKRIAVQQIPTRKLSDIMIMWSISWIQ